MSLRIVGLFRGLLIASGATLILVSSAGAQPGGGGGRGPGFGGPGGRGFGGPMGGMLGISAPLSKDDLARYEKMLNLSDEQKQAAQQAFEAYEERSKTDQDAAREAARQAFQDAGDSGNRQAAMRGVLDTAREFGQKSTEMERSFFDDLKKVLTPDQQRLWPRVERARRREKAGESSGFLGNSVERVDLVKVVDGLNLSPDARAGVDPVLDAYEADMDKELIARERANDELSAARDKEIEAQQGAGGNLDFRGMMEKLQPATDKVQEAGARAGDVNRRYTAKVQAALPEDKRPAFVRAVKQARFEDVYRPTQMGQAFDAAMALDTLDDGQRSKLKSLKGQYDRDVESVNTRLAAAMDKAEAAPSTGPGPAAFRRMRDPELTQLRREKSDLDQETYTKLKAILTPAQVAKVPRVDPPFRLSRPPPGQNGGGNNGAPAQPRGRGR